MAKRVDKDSTFQHRLKTVRCSRGLSQSAMARLIGINHKTYRRIEAGESYRIPVETLERIAQRLEVDLHWLVTGSANK